MSKQKPLKGGRHAQIPIKVLQSTAYKTLPYYAMAVLVAVAAQFMGSNNGDLAFTWSMAPDWGIRSHGQLIKALAMLKERGLIQRTRQGGKQPIGPTLYALTWHPIHPRARGYDFGIVPTAIAAHSYVSWTGDNGTAGSPDNGPTGGSNAAGKRTKPYDGNGPAGGHETADQWTHRRSLMDPPAVRKTSFLDLSAVTAPPNVRPAGGSPLRSTRSICPVAQDDATTAEELGDAPW
jgi:hypothetical protein